MKWNKIQSIEETRKLMSSLYDIPDLMTPDGVTNSALDVNSLNAGSDPSVITSMLRNVVIAENLDGDELTDINKQGDIVYNVITVVRNNPAFLSTALDENEYNDRLNTLYTIAAQCFQTWKLIAQDVYYGYEPAFDEMPSIDYEALPPRAGAPNISVFGTIIDNEGRSISLTITDKSIPQEVYVKLKYTFGLYDLITEMSHGIDLNQYNTVPYRYTTDLSQKRNSKRKTAKRTSKRKKAEPKLHEIQWVDELASVPFDEAFLIPVGRVKLTAKPGGSKTIEFFGFIQDANGNAIISSEREHTIYMFNSRNQFDELLNTIPELFGDDKALSPAYPKQELTSTPGIVFIKGVRKESAKGNTYYTDLQLIAES